MRPDEVGGGDGRVLGHAVQLEHRHAEADEELEHLGRDRRRARGGVAAAAQSEPFPHRPEHEHVPDRREHARLHRVVAHVGDLDPADAVGEAEAELEHQALEAGGVVGLDERDRVQLLPDARDREEDRRLHLAEVLVDRLDRLGEVQHRAGTDHGPGGEDPLGDVAQRQVGDDQVARVRRPAGTRFSEWTILSMQNAAFLLVSIAPFGGPVVPDV